MCRCRLALACLYQIVTLMIAAWACLLCMPACMPASSACVSLFALATTGSPPAQASALHTNLQPPHAGLRIDYCTHCSTYPSGYSSPQSCQFGSPWRKQVRALKGHQLGFVASPRAFQGGHRQVLLKQAPQCRPWSSNQARLVGWVTCHFCLGGTAATGSCRSSWAGRMSKRKWLVGFPLPVTSCWPHQAGPCLTMRFGTSTRQSPECVQNYSGIQQCACLVAASLPSSSCCHSRAELLKATA